MQTDEAPKNSNLDPNLTTRHYLCAVNSKPYIVSGPCSAESAGQMLDVANVLNSHVDLFRAGLWKPRTRPNSFEGVGKVGIEWLKLVQSETGMKVCTEVANAQHAEWCLEAGVDVLWIGARTTVNPFSVQEIADALAGTSVPVMIKNPINPDLQLWIGAIERVAKSGQREITAIHRGFSFYGESKYRNKPMWEIPIALKTHFPEMRLICDPSHITGSRELIPHVSQKAYNIGMDGLMVECHPNPDEALSDKSQQLTPEDAVALFDSLRWRSRSTDDPHLIDELSQLRSRIDELDEEILQLISSRMDVAEQIGEYKKENDLTILQLQRWQEIVSTRSAQAATLGLGEDFVTRYLEQIHRESIRKQTNVMNGKEAGSDSVLW